MKLIRSSLAVLLALAPSLLRAANLHHRHRHQLRRRTYDAQDIVVSGCTLTVNGPHSFNSLQIISAGILTHTAAANGQPNNQVNLTIAHDVLVDATSRIDVSIKGYNAAFSRSGAGVTGTINGDWGSGGGYGGYGANGTAGAKGGGAYGSITQPADWGSAGGSCLRTGAWAARAAEQSI